MCSFFVGYCFECGYLNKYSVSLQLEINSIK